MSKILIADDHPMFRLALCHALLECETALEVTEVATQATLEAKVVEEEFDLVLLDLMMPGANGFSSLVYLRAEQPELPVIIVSSNEEPNTIRRAQQFGAAAFIPKSAPVTVIGHVIDLVLAGGEWFPTPNAVPNEADGQLSQRLAQLTPQELRVLARIGNGLLNKQIAAELGLSENTVKVHVRTILKKLQCHTRTQVALLFRENLHMLG